MPDTTLKPKCYGEGANRASRDWTQRSHQSGAHIGQAGHRMINQESSDDKLKPPLHYKRSPLEKAVIKRHRQRRNFSCRAMSHESSESDDDSSSEPSDDSSDDSDSSYESSSSSDE